jgi:protein disulfide-isomerase A6|mmetsp:Transcript_45122/g.105392  ORF Transcript_45122/g.105392 Transcript_45122/m.105392 type:complete len:176 (-) Transcript_45122:527-1054(-)|eukprot:CAMPEP_0119357752 /NCGR_PEP_ID=MMETSP1334-20130426/6076_1 /TAXON_ID=127549 /ORGANISM="Calcidiscus leptoporus, Strain RCC1130" /LENGTH=175 /DNA_ID=CAMNT_0007372065 /DNA_START=199 /DNA_END=726 /DNA_ORIENTATION=-
MKPDWDTLGEKYEDSKKVLIGDVDCTGSGKKTCERFGVEGYPTLKYFNPPDTEGEAYDGGRSLKELKKFVKKLGPGCSVQTWDKCSDQQKAELQPYLDMSIEELEALRSSTQEKLDTAQSAHDVLMKSLQEQYESSEKALKALKEEKAPALKLVKVALKGKEAPAEGGTATKDEV